MIYLRYLTLHESVPARPFWDEEVLRRVAHWLAAAEGDGLDGILASDPLVVVVPGRMNYTREAELAALLAAYERVVVVATGDEEGRFDPVAAAPHAGGWWKQMPHGDPSPADVLPLGAPPHQWPAPARPHAERDFDWCFAGQVTHESRRSLARALLEVPAGLLMVSDRFAAGIPPEQYAALLGRSRVVPCPAGPMHPETFRVWEAVEAGAVPLVERTTADGRDWEWLWAHLGVPAGLTVGGWDNVAGLLASAPEGGWQHAANRMQAAWAWRAHDIAARIRDQLGVAQQPVATVVTMSPVPSHPALDVLDETLQSIRDLGPGGPVIVCCDGARDGDDRDAYTEAVRRVCDKALHDPGWESVLPLVADDWQHQANMLRLALDRIAAPLVLAVEHDTPLYGAPVPWRDLADAVLSGEVNVVRLHHEASVLPDHLRLMEGDGPIDMRGVPVWPTRQWSQRPLLASAAYLRRVLAEHFPPEARGFVEDHLYGVVEHAPWEEHRVVIYHPTGDIKRSTHTDGRAGAEKAPAYVP